MACPRRRGGPPVPAAWRLGRCGGLLVAGLLSVDQPAAAAGEAPAEACAPALLGRAQGATAATAMALVTEIDRHALQVAAAEVEAPAESGGGGAMVILAGLALVGTALAAGGLVRRRAALAAAGVAWLAALALGGPWLGERLDGAAGRSRARIDLARCRTRLMEARAAALQSLVGACLHRLSEAEEDLMGIESRLLHQGGGASPAELRRIREEMKGLLAPQGRVLP